MKSGSTRQKADHLETFSAIRLAEMCAKNIVLDASGSFFLLSLLLLLLFYKVRSKDPF